MAVVTTAVAVPITTITRKMMTLRDSRGTERDDTGRAVGQGARSTIRSFQSSSVWRRA